jgi:hypothetical protein
MSITLIIVTIMGVYIYPNSLIYTLNMCRFFVYQFCFKKATNHKTTELKPSILRRSVVVPMSIRIFLSISNRTLQVIDLNKDI